LVDVDGVDFCVQGGRYIPLHQEWTWRGSWNCRFQQHSGYNPFPNGYNPEPPHNSEAWPSHIWAICDGFPAISSLTLGQATSERFPQPFDVITLRDQFLLVLLLGTIIQVRRNILTAILACVGRATTISGAEPSSIVGDHTPLPSIITPHYDTNSNTMISSVNLPIVVAIPIMAPSSSLLPTRIPTVAATSTASVEYSCQ
jgi:hypothetical protein